MKLPALPIVVRVKCRGCGAKIAQWCFPDNQGYPRICAQRIEDTRDEFRQEAEAAKEWVAKRFGDEWVDEPTLPGEDPE